jgi:hypothetical protein
MKNILLVLTIIFLTSLTILTYSQDSLKNNDYKNAVTLEALGNGITFSFNYERIHLRKNSYSLSSRYGITYFPKLNGFNDDFQGPGIVFELINSFGKSKTKIELGIGVNSFYLFEKLDENIFLDDKYMEYIFVYTSPRIGYKYESEKRYLFRIGFTPIILLKFDSTNPNTEVIREKGIAALPWIGIGFGKIF